MISVESTPYAIRIGGIGGQGNIKMGLILAKALTYDKRWVVQTQSYGAQVRGGIAFSDVLFSQEPIDYPKANHFDIQYMMHQQPLEKFISLLRPNGILICDRSFVSQLPITIRRITRKIVSIPVTEIATERFKLAVVANVLGLGLLLKTTKIVSVESIQQAIEEEVPKKVLDVNLEAFQYGYSLVEKTYSLKDEKRRATARFE